MEKNRNLTIGVRDKIEIGHWVSVALKRGELRYIKVQPLKRFETSVDRDFVINLFPYIVLFGHK